VEHRASQLHAAVVTAADDLSAVHQHGADWNAALGAAAFGLLDRGVEKLLEPCHKLIHSGRHGFRTMQTWGRDEQMLHMALVFLVIGLIAAVLGFTTIAGASIAIAKFLAGLFLLLFLVFLIIGLTAARRIVD